MAELLQCDPVGYRRYATGARPIPRYIERRARVLELVHHLAYGVISQDDIEVSDAMIIDPSGLAFPSPDAANLNVNNNV